MTELKPCPYCGGSAAIYNTNTVFVECKDCHASGPYKKTVQSAIKAWNALPRTVRWTQEPPTEPGWYWYKDMDWDRQIVYVFYDSVHRGIFVQIMEEYPYSRNLNELKGEWAGPIQEPEI